MAVATPSAAPSAEHAELLDRARARDRAALGELLALVAPRVLAAVRSVVGRNAPDAEDLAQESLVALVAALPSFRGDASVTSFACGIAVRTALRARRKWLRRGAIDDAREATIDVDPAAPDPDEELQRARRLACLRKLLRRLPEEQAQALALRVLLGESLPEIAAATGTGINTVRSRIRLAKQALVEAIGADARLQTLFEVPDPVRGDR